MLDFISEAVQNLDYNKLSSYVIICYFSTMLVVVALNVKNALRIWIVGVLCTLSMLDLFVLQQKLPNSIIIHQIAYSLSDLAAILLLKYRLRLGDKLSKVFFKDDSSSYLYRVFTDLGYAKQESFIRLSFWFSILTNSILVVEHLIRNPHLIGLDKALGVDSMFIFNLYPYVKLGLVIALTFALLTMTVDGIVGRRLKLDPFKDG